VSDYFEGLKLAQRIGVPCKNCATASIWCGPCAEKWSKACEGTNHDAPICPWCDRQGHDICQHADDSRTCEAAR
jgi:hypothetical protein